MRVLVLVDGFHTGELGESLARLLRLDEADLLLVYVQGPDPRAGLDLVRHRPGGHRLSPHRERELDQAEFESSADAIAEAEKLARPLAATVETMEVRGEPGRAICDIAARKRVDLIAIRAGGGDQPAVGPKSLGPVARFVTDHSPCPVLLMRGGH
ncbi:MAG: universal stress protein [Candidatus Dormibacteraceae bacterium]